jgi:hypothetical protein
MTVTVLTLNGPQPPYPRYIPWKEPQEVPMRFVLAFAAACLFVLMGSQATSTQDWTTKRYLVLEDGNQLYSQCQSAEESLKLEEETVSLKPTASRRDAFPAGVCWGYIRAVVDSIPAGEGFEPDENVRLSQYLDVVTAYLRNHPNERQHPAHHLVRIALTEAFPETKRRH